MLVNLTTLTPTMRGAFLRLVEAVREHDGISPINESAALGIDGVREADFYFMGLRSDPYGFVVCDERDHTLQVCVHPDHRKDGVAYQLLIEALENHPEYTVWAFGTLPGTHELAAQLGLEAVRELLRMERDLTEPSGPEPTLDGYHIDTFTPADRDQVVAVNAAAFAHHPEQGRLTVAEFDALTRQPWFDPDGLLVARHEGRIAGFHWTKRHGDQLGEVYVLAVAPEHEGRGLGRVLLERGLNHLFYSGDTRVQLYVEGDQERVVTMYRKAGFEVVQVDTAFARRR